MVEIYFLPWLRFCLCAATAACWPALPDRMLPQHTRFAYLLCYARRQPRAGRLAGQNASHSIRDLLISLLLCGDGRVLAGSAGQRVP